MLVLFSNSPEKHREYQALLGLPELRRNPLARPEPQALLLEELTRLKVEEVVNSGFRDPFFVEHTGLFIDAWEGLPGGLTSHFISTVRCEGLCRMMSSYQGPERAARIKVAIGYWRPDRRQPRLFQAETRGLIAEQPCGDGGFGWDSIFIPEAEIGGAGRTYGQMGFAEKNQTSPRWKAAADFAATLGRDYALQPREDFAPLVLKAASIPEEERSAALVTNLSQILLHLETERDRIEGLVATIRKALPELGLSPDEESEAEAELDSLEAQVDSPKPKPGTMTSALTTLKRIFEGVTVNSVADGIVQAIRVILTAG